MSSNIKAHLALFIATLLFAINYWVSKDLVGQLDVFQLVFFRIIGAGLIFSALYFIRPRQKVSLRDKFYLAIIAAIGIALNQLLFFGGLQYTSPVDTATIHVSNPIIVMVLSTIFLHTKLRKTQIWGIAFGAIGALILILYQKEFQWTDKTILGNLMIFGNTLAYAVFLIMLKPLLKKYSPLTTMFWIYLFASIIIIPLAIHSMLEIQWVELIKHQGVSLMYIIVMITFVAYFLSIYSLKKLSPMVVSFYIYLQPVLAFIIAVFLGEQLPHLVKIGATLLIFYGVYLVNKTRSVN